MQNIYNVMTIYHCNHLIIQYVVITLAKDDVGPSSIEELIETPQNDSRKFTSLEGTVSEKTLNAVADMGFTDMMEIQFKSIRPLLEGKYVRIVKEHIVLCICQLNYLELQDINKPVVVFQNCIVEELVLLYYAQVIY